MQAVINPDDFFTFLYIKASHLYNYKHSTEGALMVFPPLCAREIASNENSSL